MQVVQKVSDVSFLTPKPIKSNYPLFIYLPGMDATGKLLHTQVDDLTRHFDIRCLSIAPNNLSDWDNLASQVIDLIIEELRNRKYQSVYLCGESFGGCLALKIATIVPWLFQKIILVNPASSFKQQPLLSFGIPLTQWLPDFLYQGSTSVLLPFLASTGRIKECDRQKLLNAMNSLPLNTVSWRLSLLRDFMIKPQDLSKLIQPVLIMASGADLLLPSINEAKRLLNYFPNGILKILPHSGHACLLEKEVNLHQILKDW